MQSLLKKFLSLLSTLTMKIPGKNYSVRIIQHEEHGAQRSINSAEMSGVDNFKENLLKPGFALKAGGAKQTVFFSLEQKY